MAKAVYVPWLHMHQPLIMWKIDGKEQLIGNLEKMLSGGNQDEVWNAKLMLRAYNNPAKYVEQLKKGNYNPKIILDYSGILLESLNGLKTVEINGEKIPNVVKKLKEVLTNYPSSIEITGTAYSHCYFPTTPEEDWIYQIEAWREVFGKLFGKKCLENVKGFWLPEMGVPAFEDKLSELIKAIKEFYEWLILPMQAVEGYEQLSYEQRIQMACQPHMLEVWNQSIPVIFRIPADFIDQQAGCDVNCVYGKALEATKIFEKVSNKPALILPASDGENGNVMMNEFFPETYLPIFKEKVGHKISSMTVTEFLHKFYEKDGKIVPTSKVKLKIVGSSWVGSHKSWIEGTRREEMMNKIFEISKEFHEIENKIGGSELKDLRRLLLIAETSCYVYWGTEFWFDEGEKVIGLLKKQIESLKSRLYKHL